MVARARKLIRLTVLRTYSPAQLYVHAYVRIQDVYVYVYKQM